MKKIILGIDPGTAKMGYGVIKYKNPKLDCIEYGVIETETNTDEYIRLEKLYAGLKVIVEKYQPDYIAVEDIFYFKNQKTLIQVAAARGIALLIAAHTGKMCFSFTPLQVKQAVSGYGRAEKKQVQHMVKVILNLSDIPKPDDAADALAIAICCAHSYGTLMLHKN